MGPLTIAVAGVATCIASCGADVNLGGTTDASAPDAGRNADEVSDLCEPCDTGQQCPVGATCAALSGSHRFCATPCPRGSECDTDDICKLVASSVAGESVRACAPAAGTCATPPPPVADGAVVEHCGALEGPTIIATCKSCDKDDSDCQRNGCYGGWWCNTTNGRCQKPPANCP